MQQLAYASQTKIANFTALNNISAGYTSLKFGLFKSQIQELHCSK
jgi:hypothetical protein